MKEMPEDLQALQREEDREPMTMGDRLGIVLLIVAVIAFWGTVFTIVRAVQL